MGLRRLRLRSLGACRGDAGAVRVLDLDLEEMGSRDADLRVTVL